MSDTIVPLTTKKDWMSDLSDADLRTYIDLVHRIQDSLAAE